MYNYTHSYSWSIEKFFERVIQRILKADERKFCTSVTSAVILTETPYYFNLGKCLVLYKFGNKIVFIMNPAILILLMV